MIKNIQISILIVVVVLILVLLDYNRVSSSSVPPDDWKKRIEQGHLLFSSDLNLSELVMPDIGNGYLATRLTSNATYVAGLFNGLNVKTPSHRARIPSTVQTSFKADGLKFIGG
jgi:hypothetical protein